MLDVQQYLPTWRGDYPHMFPLDKEVWNKFLAKYGNLYKGFQYDVTCGMTSEPEPHWTEPTIKDAQILSKLRIDVVGESQDFIDIIEVKPRGNMSAIGQLLTYRQHYTADYEPQKPVRMVLVCSDIDPNIVQLAEDNKIIYMVV